MKRNCCWVIIPNSAGVEATYCLKPVRYYMKEDDDGNKVRKYNPFCDHHQSLADKEEEEGWGV